MLKRELLLGRPNGRIGMKLYKKVNSVIGNMKVKAVNMFILEQKPYRKNKRNFTISIRQDDAIINGGYKMTQMYLNHEELILLRNSINDILDCKYEEEPVKKDITFSKEFKLNEVMAARSYASDNETYIAIFLPNKHIPEGMIWCKKFSQEEILYLACDALYDYKGNELFNSFKRLDCIKKDNQEER